MTETKEQPVTVPRSAEDTGLPQVGARVLILRHFATVKYVGPVAGQKGIWAGVEYDDPTRGKHDGITGGVRYFTCSHPQSGSFVRVEKLDRGCSVVDALFLRYHNRRAEGNVDDVSQDELWVRTAGHRRVNIQVVGEDTIQALQSQTDRLVQARLVAAGVSTVGDPTALSTAGARLIQLDLSSNLITQWEGFVVPLCAALPQLQVLNLSDNKLCEISPSIQLPVMPNLQVLVLNDTGWTWKQALHVARYLPQLQELHLAGNGLQQFDTGESQASEAATTALKSLQVLSLEDNKVNSWSDIVACIGYLPSLRVLNLSNNPLSDLRVSNSDNSSSTAFASLESLYLASCSITSWSDVDVLDTLPKLADLRLTGNPLLANSRGGGRYEIIGRVAGLTMLNGSRISSRERTDCEVRYLQACISESLSPEGLIQSHPRYTALASKYGQVLATNTATSSTTSLGKQLIELTLVSQDGAKTLTKKFPPSTQTRALKLVCEKLFGIKVGDQVLRIEGPSASGQDAVEPGDDTASLGSLDVQSGSKVVVGTSA